MKGSGAATSDSLLDIGEEEGDILLPIHPARPVVAGKGGYPAGPETGPGYDSRNGSEMKEEETDDKTRNDLDRRPRGDASG